MSEAVEQRNATWIIFSGPQKAFSIFFHKFDMYFSVLLRYFYGIKSVILEGAWIFYMETFDAPLLAEMISFQSH